MAGVITDNPQHPTTFDEFTFFATWFDASFDFHRLLDKKVTLKVNPQEKQAIIQQLLGSENNPAFGLVIRRNFAFDFISRHDLDPI